MLQVGQIVRMTDTSYHARRKEDGSLVHDHVLSLTQDLHRVVATHQNLPALSCFGNHVLSHETNDTIIESLRDGSVRFVQARFLEPTLEDEQEDMLIPVLREMITELRDEAAVRAIFAAQGSGIDAGILVASAAIADKLEYLLDLASPDSGVSSEAGSLTEDDLIAILLAKMQGTLTPHM